MQACYARQSIDKKDSISVDTQLEKAKMECHTNEPIEEYADKGFSGKNTKRPEFQRLMQDVKEDKISRIVVYKIDRFSRSLMDFANAWEVLSRHKVDFISVNEKFDTSTPIGKAMLFILMVFAQLERETIAERVTDNYYARAKQGSWIGGPAPYGYDIGRIESAGRSIPTLCSTSNIAVVERIFHIYAEGNVSLGELAAILNNEGIHGVQRKTWNNVTLARMMHNPVYVRADADIYAYYKNLGVKIVSPLSDFIGVYAGMLVGKRGASTRQRKKIQEASLSIANWEGIIPSEIWLTCQARLAKNRQIKNTGKGQHTWLSGLLKCGKCGRMIRVTADYKNPKRKKYMMCTGHIDHYCDNIISIRLDTVEEIIEKHLIDILENCADEPVPVETNGLTPAEKIELQEMEDRISNLMNILASGKAADPTVRYVNEEIENIENRRNELSKRILEQPVKQHITYEHVDFNKLSFEERKIVVTAYIDRILITGDDVEIVWSV